LPANHRVEQLRRPLIAQRGPLLGGGSAQRARLAADSVGTISHPGLTQHDRADLSLALERGGGRGRG
jgi:hypothetical protein